MKCCNWCAVLSLCLFFSVCASNCVHVTALTAHVRFVLACTHAHGAVLCMCSVRAGCCIAAYV